MDRVSSAENQPPVKTAGFNRALPIVLAVALFMENMDSTVISTSLPAIARDIETSPIALKLALTAYLVSVAIFIPVSGWMADRYGAKNVFRTAIAVFVIGSIACAFSGSLSAFVGARFLQGMGGAMMTPVARLVLVRATSKADLVNAMALLTIPGLIGPLVGPPVGGFITTYFSWHWIFLINVPIGLAGIYFAGRIMPEMPGIKGARIDAAGFVMAGLAASGLVFGLSVTSLPVLPMWVGLLTVGVGLVSGLFYIRHARRHAAPIIDLRMFRNPTFRRAIMGGTLFRFGIGAIPFLLPLFFQLVFNLTPFQSGLLTFASAGGALMMKMLAPSLLRRGGFRTVLISAGLIGGILIIANGFFTAATPHLVITVVLLFAGFFRSLFFTSANALVFAEVENKDAGQATAIAAASQQISVAIGVAIAGAILEIAPIFTGVQLGQSTFVIAFTIVGLISMLAIVPFFFMDRNAGSDVSGHRRPPPPEDPVAQQPPVV
ncbi:MFS transporter [Tianweitania populi]|uniref:MFS transporter n=1 Tax=Tianweitania populi TaxID=1607949 RepID=A0A8J3DM23_9HYPH|nr:MFS transporter [Tianweitania populi]GHD05660.1 MFS transporter [Tianweitania populi]